MKTREYKKTVSDESVKKATSRNWEQWFAILDQAKMFEKSHREMARWLSDNHTRDDWWAQTIIVGYEQARGLRKPGQRPDGTFSVSISKVMNLSASRLYEVWTEESIRRKWLGDDAGLEITTANKDRNIRGKWADRGATINVSFYRKTEDRAQVVIQLDKLPEEHDVADMRSYWKSALARLGSLIDSH